jgi:hypothetical protein
LGKLFGLEAGPPPASDAKDVEWKSFDLYLDAKIAYKHRAKWCVAYISAIPEAEREDQLLHFLAIGMEEAARSRSSLEGNVTEVPVGSYHDGCRLVR